MNGLEVEQDPLSDEFREMLDKMSDTAKRKEIARKKYPHLNLFVEHKYEKSTVTDVSFLYENTDFDLFSVKVWYEYGPKGKSAIAEEVFRKSEYDEWYKKAYGTILGRDLGIV